MKFEKLRTNLAIIYCNLVLQPLTYIIVSIILILLFRVTCCKLILMCAETDPKNEVTDSKTDSKTDIVDTLMTPIYSLAGCLLSEPSKNPSEETNTIVDYSIMTPFRLLGELLISSPDNVPSKEDTTAESDNVPSKENTTTESDNVPNKEESDNFSDKEESESSDNVPSKEESDSNSGSKSSSRSKSDSKLGTNSASGSESKAGSDSNSESKAESDGNDSASDTTFAPDDESTFAQYLFEVYKDVIKTCQTKEELVQHSMDFMREYFPIEILAEDMDDMNRPGSYISQLYSDIETKIEVTTPSEQVNVEYFRITILVYNTALIDNTLDQISDLEKHFNDEIRKSSEKQGNKN